jgi:hypothetical protein
VISAASKGDPKTVERAINAPKNFISIKMSS